MENEMTNDAAVAHRIFSESTGYWGPWRIGPLPEFADPEARTELAYSATTVAELRAEVERLTEQLRYVADACEHETARADAAERRVAELRQALLSVEAALGPNVHLYDTTSDMARALEVTVAVLTKDSP